MTTPPLEDRLSRLADGLIAPASPDVRSAIGQRTGVLRRRRRTRRAVAAGAFAALAVAGSVAVLGDTAHEPRTQVADTGVDDLPAIVLDLNGWEVTTAEDATIGTEIAADHDTVQVFERPDDPDGPRMVLRHSAASDALVPEPGVDEPVTVDGAPGVLRPLEGDGLLLRWSPPIGDNEAAIEATGLTREQILAFAEDLEPLDDAISYPPTPDEEFGFAVGDLPAGLVEVPSIEEQLEDAPARRVTAVRGDATADLTVAATGDAAYPDLVELPVGAELEDLTVMGRQATLVRQPLDPTWWLVWHPEPGVTARVVVTGLDPAAVDDVLAGLREVTDDEWDQMARTRPG